MALYNTILTMIENGIFDELDLDILQYMVNDVYWETGLMCEYKGYVYGRGSEEFEDYLCQLDGIEAFELGQRMSDLHVGDYCIYDETYERWDNYTETEYFHLLEENMAEILATWLEEVSNGQCDFNVDDDIEEVLEELYEEYC